jgi:ribosomal protein S24E
MQKEVRGEVKNSILGRKKTKVKVNHTAGASGCKFEPVTSFQEITKLQVQIR